MMIVSPTRGCRTGCPNAEMWKKNFVPFTVAKPNLFSSFHCVTVALFVMGMSVPEWRFYLRLKYRKKLVKGAKPGVAGWRLKPAEGVMEAAACRGCNQGEASPFYRRKNGPMAL